MNNLWDTVDRAPWQAALADYDKVIAGQQAERLPELDHWYHKELPRLIGSRDNAHITRDELVRVTEWKMKRGVWRGRNLALVKSNDADLVVERSTLALGAVPHPTKPIAALSELAGVGPATSSAVLAAFAPETYPFFDEIVAGQISGLGEVAFTISYYARYAEAIRRRAFALGGEWKPADVERALWSNAGGKAGIRASSTPNVKSLAEA